MAVDEAERASILNHRQADPFFILTEQLQYGGIVGVGRNVRQRNAKISRYRCTPEEWSSARNGHGDHG
ncbi:hypothetical protein Pcaca05_30210 [Pectobacterium carotovorum subsp. carotovorum]|nr:hypothetical protein Pcaca05_30210 [Pectobacterium carotovorum subsp. carotovorum]